MFGTKVVNTELHKALPVVASHVDQLGVQALQVPPLCPSSFSFLLSPSPYPFPPYFLALFSLLPLLTEDF